MRNVFFQKQNTSSSDEDTRFTRRCRCDLFALVCEMLKSLPTSEVRYNPRSTTFEEQFRVLLEQQNQNFFQLAGALRASSGESLQNGDIVLPKFISHIAGADAMQWCATVDIMAAIQTIVRAAI